MTRVISLAVLAAVVFGLLLLPRPNPSRLAARHAGNLLGEPAQLPEGTDWRAALAPGDTVEAGGREGVITSVEDDAVVVEYGPDDDASTTRADVTELVEKRPLWRYLTDPVGADPIDEGYRLRVRGYRMSLGGSSDQRLHETLATSVYRGLRAIGASEGFEIEVQERLNASFDGLFLQGLHEPGVVRLSVQAPDGSDLAHAEAEWYPPNGRSLIPPLVAILLAIMFRRPVLALFSGVLAGSVLERLATGAAFGESSRDGALNVVQNYLWTELADSDRLMIVSFVVFMLAMVGVITRAGGIHGMMDRIASIAKDARRTQIASWLMGLVVFFDDYANSILVGSTMRPLTDRFKVAREKLAYIVDSTAAPVAGISILSTWIAFEVSTFSAQLPEAELAPSDGYAVFLETLPYRFYCIFTLFFVGLIVFSGRDFGPMLRAERRARGGKVLRDGAKPMVGEAATKLQPAPNVTPRASVALLPILTFVFVTLGYIFVQGGALTVFDPNEGFDGFGALLSLEGLTTVLYDGSGFAPLMWGSLAGLLLAAVLAWTAGLTWEIVTSAWASLRSMGIALVILYLAWMIGAVCRDLGTASYLAVLAGDSINPLVLPVGLFLLSGFVAFATGSSWSTMTILLPLVVGLSFELGESVEGFGGHAMLVISIGAVLEGAIFGDHCSPISDTTVMSSIACASDHVDHVRTQGPYAVTTMMVAILCGYLPAVIIGLSPYLSLAFGAVAMTAFVFLYGKKAEDSAPAPADVEVSGAEGS